MATSVGVVALQALPAPDWSARASEEYVAPVSELEAQLQAIFQEVLGQQRVSTQADFFAIGGNSLQARLTHQCFTQRSCQCRPACAWRSMQ